MAIGQPHVFDGWIYWLQMSFTALADNELPYVGFPSAGINVGGIIFYFVWL